MTIPPIEPTPCDAPNASRHPDGTCRCLICARCGRHTGNSHQGHYWRICKAKPGLVARDFHFCCPGDCELEARGGEQP